MGTKYLRTSAVVILAVSAVVLAGCSGSPSGDTSVSPGAYDPSSATSTSASDMDALVAAAKQEGTLTLYTDGTLAAQQTWASDFTTKYGIQVQIVRDSGGPLYAKFSQEEAAGQGQADVFGNVDSQSLDDAVDNGWLAQYTPVDGPLFPEDASRYGYYYPYLMGSAHALIYNPTKVTQDELAEVQADPVKAMEDPRFKGRIGICPPQLALLAAAFWYQYTDGPAKDTVGWDGLAKIAANTQLITDTATLEQDVIQGEVDFAFPVADSIATRSLVQDPTTPIAFVYPTPTVSTQFGMGVVAKSPHPAAARLFAEWAASKEGSDDIAKINGNLSLHQDGFDGRGDLTSLPWYKAYDSDEVWNSSVYTKDQTFLAAAGSDGDFDSHWSQVFGYSG